MITLEQLSRLVWSAADCFEQGFASFVFWDDRSYGVWGAQPRIAKNGGFTAPDTVQIAL